MIDNSRNSTIFLAVAFLGAAAFAGPGLTRAQAPPGPLPQAESQDAPPPPPRPQVQKAPVQPRTSIFGGWKLDRDDSDDGPKKMQEARPNNNSNAGYGANRARGGGHPGGASRG